MEVPLPPEDRAAGILHGVVRRITYRSPDGSYVVLRLDVSGQQGPVSVVGRLDPVPGVGQEIRVVGRWAEHPSYGRQFRAHDYHTVTPDTLEGIERFLASGVIKGVGRATARRLVERFGERTLDVIASDPDAVAALPGIGSRKANAILRQAQALRDRQEALVFLHSLGVGPGLARRIVGRYGPRTIEAVRNRPYLLALEVGGIGFRRADELARRFGIGPTDPQRVDAAVWHVLQEAAEQGHLYLPVPRLHQEVTALLASTPASQRGVPSGQTPETAPVSGEEAPGEAQSQGISEQAVRSACERLAARGGVVVEDECAYLAYLYAYETRFARRLVELARRHGGQAWLPQRLETMLAEAERRHGLVLAAEQREAVRRALEEGVLVITGGPGTGKTTLVRFIVELAAAAGRRVGLAAPTGRAAQRLNDAVFSGGLPPRGVSPARTIHRLLELRVGSQAGNSGEGPHPRSQAGGTPEGVAEGGGVRFARNRRNPLEVDLLIVDETSMLDMGLAYHLVEALRPGSQLVLVGDVDQLPSVGPGQVLRDLMECGVVSVVRLTRLFRQASRSSIVRGAHQVLAGHNIVRAQGAPAAAGPQGRKPQPRKVAVAGPTAGTGADGGDGTSGELRFVEVDDPAECARRVCELVVDALPARYGLDPMRDIQVLAASHRGPAGTEALNGILQAALNPPAPNRPELVLGARRLRLGDRVMQTRNDYQARVVAAGGNGGAGTPGSLGGRLSLSGQAEEGGVFNGEVGRIWEVNPRAGTLRVRFDDGRVIEYDGERLGQLELAYAVTVHKSQGNEFPCVVMPVVWTMPALMTRHLLYTAITRGRRLVVLVGQRRAILAYVRNASVAKRFSRLAERLRAESNGLRLEAPGTFGPAVAGLESGV